MTLRESAINEAMQKMAGRDARVWAGVLSDLIDQAEAGKLKEASIEPDTTAPAV